jgi:hypothetical protein
VLFQHEFSYLQKDFEDAVLNESGHMEGADIVITRNIKDFSGSELKVCDPDEFFSLLL